MMTHSVRQVFISSYTGRFLGLPLQRSDIKTYQTSFLILFALQPGCPHSQTQAFVYVFLSVQSDEGVSIQEMDSPFSFVGMRLAQSVIDCWEQGATSVGFQSALLSSTGWHNLSKA